MDRFEQDVIKLATAKIAGMMDYLPGSQGSISSLGSTLGGAGLGAMAGMGLGPIGAIGGGLLGGLGGYGMSNAINTQGAQQNGVDNAMMGAQLNDAMGMSPVDQQQNQVLQGLVDYLGASEQASMGGMDPAMMGGMGGGMDPAMMGGMDPAMMGGMPQGMPQGAPQQGLPPAAPPQQGGKQASAKEAALIEKLANEVLVDMLMVGNR